MSPTDNLDESGPDIVVRGPISDPDEARPELVNKTTSELPTPDVDLLGQTGPTQVDVSHPELLDVTSPEPTPAPGLQPLDDEKTSKDDPAQMDPVTGTAPLPMPIPSPHGVGAARVTGGEVDIDTPLGIRVQRDSLRVERPDDLSEHTEVVGRQEDGVISRDSGALGWILAFVVFGVATITVSAIYLWVLRPMQAEVDALRGELAAAQARESEVRIQLQDLARSKYRLEAATEALNKQVEEQEGEIDAVTRDQEAEDAERRREAERKAKKGKKKRKKRRAR